MKESSSGGLPFVHKSPLFRENYEPLLRFLPLTLPLRRILNKNSSFFALSLGSALANGAEAHVGCHVIARFLEAGNQENQMAKGVLQS